MTYWTDMTQDGVAFVVFKAVINNIVKPTNEARLT